MSYAFRAAGTATVSNGKQTGTVALPAGIQVGDLMVAFLSVSTGGTGFTAPAIGTPSGWTQLGSTLVNEGASAGIRGAWYYRWVDGNDTGPSWVFDPTILFKHAAVVVAWSGGPGVGVPAITTGNGATGSSTTTNTAPSINCGTTPTWTAQFYSERSTTNGSYTTPAGETLRASAFGSGGAAADLLVVDSNANVTGTDGGDATTAGTAATWSLNAIVELPPLGVASTGAATVSLSGTANTGTGISAAATVTVTGAASDSPVAGRVAAAVTLAGSAQATTAPVGFRSSAALSGNSTTASSFNPAGVLAGDLLVAHLIVATGGSGSTQPATPTPTGYTLLTTQTSQSATAGTVGAWYYRWASGSDTAPTIVLDGTQVFKWTLAVTAHSGGDGASVPQIVTGIDPQSPQTTHTAETMNLVGSSTWIMTSLGIRSSTNATFTTPSGLTALAEVFGTGGAAASLAVFDTHADVSGLVGGGTTVSDTASTYGVHATISIPPRGAHTLTAAASLTLTGLAKTTITNASHSVGWGISNNSLASAESVLGRPVDFLRDYGWFGFFPNIKSLASSRRMILSMKFKTNSLGIVPSTDITSHLYDTQIDAWGTAFIALPQCAAGPHIAVPEHEIDAATAQSSGTVAQLNAAFAYVVNRWRNLPGWNGQVGTIITGGSGGSYGTNLTAVQRAALFTADYNISDVVGIDNPYINTYPGSSGDATVGPVVDWFTANYPAMPLFIGEWGALPGTGTQRANWITAFGAALTKTRYSKVFAATYWNNGSYALDAAGLTAWAAGGQRAQGPVGGDANVTLTATANVALKFPAQNADAAITLTAAANITSSTAATRPAALLTLLASATITGPSYALAPSATLTLTAAVGAPPAFMLDGATAVLTVQATATATFAAFGATFATAFVDLEASAIGPPVVANIVPVNCRVRIIANGGNFILDISTLCSAVEITRGRTSPLETSIAAAVCVLTLDDSASTFDPDNTQSPLYGFINPGWQSDTTLHVDEFVPALGGYIDLFCGGLQGLQRTFTGGDESISTGTWVDQTFDLSKHKIAAGTVLPAELPGARIARLLGMPARTGFVWTSRSLSATVVQLDAGQKMLSALTCDGTTSSWDYASAAAAAEGGLLYFDAAGVLIFSGQQDRLTSNVVWNLGDQAGMTPIETDLTYAVSTDSMILDVAVTIADGSTRMFGPGGASFVPSGVTFNADVTETSLLAGWNSAASRAEYVYATQSKPRRNATTVTLEVTPVAGVWRKGGAPTAYQAAVLARIGDLAAITRTPSVGDPIVANYWVEGMHMLIAAAGQWTTTLNVSRADPVPSGGYWVLGQVNVNTVLTW